MPRRRKKSSLPDNQMVLIKAEASYPRRWQGIRSKRPYEAQVKGTMFEKAGEECQMDLFADPSEVRSGETAIVPRNVSLP